MAHLWFGRPDIQRVMPLAVAAEHVSNRDCFDRITRRGSSTMELDIADRGIV